MNTCEVWIIHSRREILVTQYPGPPADVCGFVSEEAAKAATNRGFPTVSEIGFQSDCFLGQFETPIFGWGKAGEVAEAKAKELGYKVDYHPMISDLEEEE